VVVHLSLGELTRELEFEFGNNMAG